MGRIPERRNQSAQANYIKAHLECGGVRSRAAEKAGVPIQTVYRWFQRDKKFLEKIQQAEKQLFEMLIATGIQRALNKSDTLLMFFLKSHEPERFDDNIRKAKWLAEHNLTDPDNQPANIENVTIQILKKPE